MKIIFFTGLSGSGKSTIAELLKTNLTNLGYNTYILDGDIMRLGLCKDLGFSDSDRVENIRRASESAKLLAEVNVIPICAFISPSNVGRNLAKQILKDFDFVEGLYKKVRKGEIKNFTGVDSLYEIPQNPNLTLDASISPESCVKLILEKFYS